MPLARLRTALTSTGRTVTGSETGKQTNELREWLRGPAESGSFILRVSHSQIHMVVSFSADVKTSGAFNSVIIQNLTSGRVCVIGGALPYSITFSGG